MNLADEYVESLEEQDHVHEAIAIDDTTVAVIKRVQMNDEPSVFLNTGWRVVLHVPSENGDVIVFRAVE